MNRREFLITSLALSAVGSGCRRDGHANRLGASTASLAGASLLEAILTFEALDFGTIELIAYTGASHSIGAIPGFDFYASDQAHREEVFAATRGFAHISAHMPFAGLHLLSSEPSVRRSATDEIKRSMDGLAFLEGSVAVVHPGWPEQGKTFRDVWPLMIDLFRSLGDYAGEKGLKIGLETMQPNAVEDYTALLYDIDHPAVGATVDTGHIRGATDINLADEEKHTSAGTHRFNDVLNRLVEELGEKLIHVHLSDVQKSDWRDHKTVGTGIIDFGRFFGSLRNIGYSGLLVFELEEPNPVAALKASKSHVESVMNAA